MKLRKRNKQSYKFKLKKDKKNDYFSKPYLRNNHFSYFYFLLLAGCGGGSQQNTQANTQVVLATTGVDFVNPQISYGLNNSGQQEDPYWLTALIQLQQEENGYFNVVSSTNGFKFSFPISPPSYLSVSEQNGWQTVNEKVKVAARNLFAELDQKLNISFKEVSNPNATSVISIMSNKQTMTTGYAYDPLDVLYPTDNYLFSDVFLSLDYTNPLKTGNNTNFDYELIVHEVGHALGLRHPFKVSSGDGIYLSPKEENNKWTVMSYDFNTTYFDGTYRMLDWAALANLYGINPNYNPSSNIYSFNSISGSIILDGAGIDTISAKGQVVHSYLDLRTGSHSYVGNKSSLITDPFQLSVGNSLIENAEGGNGNDWLIGNETSNTLMGLAGDDVIYGGSGSDIIYGGLGNDIIDLTEPTQSKDIVVFEDDLNVNGVDVIYAFKQGINGDALQFSNFKAENLMSTVFSQPDHNINISNKICLVQNESIASTNGVMEEINNGNLKNLNLENGFSSIVIGAVNQSTGSNQYIYELDRIGNDITITGIALLSDNQLDLDSWSEYNFV